MLICFPTFQLPCSPKLYPCTMEAVLLSLRQLGVWRWTTASTGPPTGNGLCCGLLIVRYTYACSHFYCRAVVYCLPFLELWNQYVFGVILSPIESLVSEISAVIRLMIEQILTCVYYGMSGAGCVGREQRVRAIAITGFSADAALRIASAVRCAILLRPEFFLSHASASSQVGDSVAGRPETAATWAQVPRNHHFLRLCLCVMCVCDILCNAV